MITRIGLFSAAVLFTACGGRNATAPTPPVPSPTASAAPAPLASSAPSVAPLPSAAPPAAPPHFSYAGEDGPEHWATLDPSFAACAGAHQSPIDLPLKASGPSAAIDPPHFEKFPLKILNNGHTVQVNDSAPSSLVIGGTTYALAQFHFHMPSEHRIAGNAFEGELHFVFKSGDGHLAVIGMFIKEGKKANTPLADVIEHAPADKGPEQTIEGSTIDVTTILPARASFLSYDGSLTVPPCTEGVTWLVVPPKTGIVELSLAQLAKLNKALHAPTNRPIQPANGRAPSDVKIAPPKP